MALLTEWDHFKALDPRWLGRLVATRAVVDARHALDPEAWRAAGWTYRALGPALTFASGVPPTRARTDLLDKCGSCVSGGCKDGVVRQ